MGLSVSDVEPNFADVVINRTALAVQRGGNSLRFLLPIAQDHSSVVELAGVLVISEGISHSSSSAPGLCICSTSGVRNSETTVQLH